MTETWDSAVRKDEKEAMMPEYDRPGPQGSGPMTGGGRGLCQGGLDRKSGGGFMGQGFCRGGRKNRMGRQGFGMGFGRGFRTGFPEKIQGKQDTGKNGGDER